MTKHIYCDVVIAGCGVAGLYTALNLPEDLHVLMICKEDMDTCDSMLAQGGICVLRGEDDYEPYFESWSLRKPEGKRGFDDTHQPRYHPASVRAWGRV